MIIPFTSCEASKIPTSERSKRVSFLMHRNWWVKSFKHFPWYDVFISYKLRFFQISIQRLATNACENTSFVQSETRTIVLDSTSKCKSQYLQNKKYVDSARVAFYRCISFSRHGGSSSKNKQEYKPDVKLEYYDDNGRPLTPKEVRFILNPLFFSAFFRAFFRSWWSFPLFSWP